MPGSDMRISELAALTDETTRTLRFYEAAGVLTPPSRTPGGYRDYNAAAVDEVGFVRALQQAGLSLDEIAALIRIRGGDACISADDATLVASAQSRVNEQLETLSRARTHLTASHPPSR